MSCPRSVAASSPQAGSCSAFFAACTALSTSCASAAATEAMVFSVLWRVSGLAPWRYSRQHSRWVDRGNCLSTGRRNELVVYEKTRGLRVLASIRGFKFYRERHDGGPPAMVMRENMEGSAVRGSRLVLNLDRRPDGIDGARLSISTATSAATETGYITAIPSRSIRLGEVGGRGDDGLGPLVDKVGSGPWTAGSGPGLAWWLIIGTRPWCWTRIFPNVVS